ncbi:hypothetical protein [Filifactor alocis]|uniref:hypothetical protein n=1 Tax=Filifactor alocis TaxID=143361 RepID=UPI003FA0BB8F
MHTKRIILLPSEYETDIKKYQEQFKNAIIHKKIEDVVISDLEKAYNKTSKTQLVNPLLFVTFEDKSNTTKFLKLCELHGFKDYVFNGKSLQNNIPFELCILPQLIVYERAISLYEKLTVEIFNRVNVLFMTISTNMDNPVKTYEYIAKVIYLMELYQNLKTKDDSVIIPEDDFSPISFILQLVLCQIANYKSDAKIIEYILDTNNLETLSDDAIGAISYDIYQVLQQKYKELQ